MGPDILKCFLVRDAKASFSCFFSNLLFYFPVLCRCIVCAPHISLLSHDQSGPKLPIVRYKKQEVDSDNIKPVAALI